MNNMKKNFLFIVLILVFTNVNAQFNIGKSSGQTITEKSINGCAVVVKQSYQVKNKKTGKVFGRGGRNDFGRSFSIAIKTELGLVLSDYALTPWLEDNAFKKVENDYDPVISLTETRSLDDKTQCEYKQFPLEIGRQQPEGLWIAQFDIADNTMEIDTDKGLKDGWLIWFVSQNDLSFDESAPISLNSINSKLEVNGEDFDIDINPPTNEEKVVGGIYVCPTFLGGGHVSFRLVGLTVKVEDKWKLRAPFVGFSINKSEKVRPTSLEEETQPEEDIKEKDDNEVNLTPVEESKDKKKATNKKQRNKK